MTVPAAIGQAFLASATTAQYGSPALINPGGPAFAARAPQNSPDPELPTRGSPVLMAALREHEGALPGYMEASEYYNGEAGDDFASVKIQKLLAMSGVQDVPDLNYAKTPVDTIVSKLGIRAVTVSAGDDSSTEEGDRDGSAGDDPPKAGAAADPAAKTGDKAKKSIAERAQEKLDALRKRNQLKAEEQVLFKKASEYGEAYLFQWPVVRGADPEAFEGGVQLDPEHPGTVVSVDIFVNSPTICRVFYDPENPLLKTHALKTWEWTDPDAAEDDDATRTRATLYFKDRVERWVTKPNAGGKGNDIHRPESWVPYLGGSDEWPLPNPTEQIPFWHFRTERPYGIPEHRAAYGPQKLINKLVSAHAVTIDYQSFPQRYALSNPKMDDVLGNLIDPDNPEDDDDDPEGDGRSQLRADPAAVWKMPGITSVGQFAAADPSVFMNPLDRYVRAMAELTGTPLHRFTGYSTPPSGESLTVANEPLYEKAGERRTGYEAELANAYEFALGLLGEKDITVTVQWKPLSVASGAADWQIVSSKVANGVPVKRALVEAGYPQDDVDAWLNDETGSDLTRRVMLLNSVGTAVQALGTGVAVGVVSPEQVGHIIAQILGAVGDDLPALEEPVELRPVQANAANASQQFQGSPPGGPPGAADTSGGDGAPATMPALPPPPSPVQVGT